MISNMEKDPSLSSIYKALATDVLEGKAQIEKGKIGGRFVFKETNIMLNYVLSYYLFEIDNAGFDFEKARNFAEKMRELIASNSPAPGDISFLVLSTLEEWFNINVRDRYFYDTNAEENDKRRATGKHVWSGSENFILRRDMDILSIPQEFIHFSCYVAICHIKYGSSYMSVVTNRIFGYITALGSDLPAKMKKYGSGDMPKELLEYKNATLSCKANDAFATIKFTLKEENEDSYAKVLDFLIQLLKAEFPLSYSIDFRSPEKNYLHIKKLPKKGVNQLFANAIQYPSLHEKIEQYARLSMNEFEWYNNLENENCAMTGTFAVFALGLLGEAYHSLVTDYIKICDGEHQQLHGEFVLAYIEKYGFTEKGLELYTLCEQNIQELPKKLVTLHKKMM